MPAGVPPVQPAAMAAALVVLQAGASWLRERSPERMAGVKKERELSTEA